MMQKTINVHIGEVKIARDGELLKAILGSCVGIGIIWKSKSICGLAHCLLPQSPTPTFEVGGKYVDQAVRSLISLMKIAPEDYNSISVVIVGGGHMTKSTATNTSHVGSNNFKAALNEVQKRNLPISYSEGCGEFGRMFFIDSSSLSYKIEKIAQLAA